MFEDTLYKVKNKDGNEVTVESEDGIQCRRNSARVKRYETEECLNPEPVDAEETSTRENGVSCERKPEQILSRPRRDCRPPKRFEEYSLYIQVLIKILGELN